MGDIKALFELIDKKNKRRLISAVFCCVLSVLCGILPYFGVFGIVTCFLNKQTGNLYQYVCLIVAAIILKHLLFGTGTKISHKVAYQTLGETRKKLFRKIACLPMGYVKTTASGQVKTIIMDNMEQLETFYAHNIPEIISGLAVPLCMEILLAILDIRVAGIMLIPVVLFIFVSVLMIMVQMKKMDEFNQAFADVSVKTVEYINGMKELKIFSADESTYGRLAESIRTYSTVVTEWFQSCLKYVAFNHADLNSNLVFLFPLAGLMYLSGSVTAASFIMYLFIEKLPQGYQTVICEGGASLSGGERQRVAIARAILKDSPIILLDEALSSLDAENAIIIQKGIEEMIKGKTVFLVSHTLSYIQNADQILVLSDGALQGCGKHDELLQTVPLYKTMWEKENSIKNWKLA